MSILLPRETIDVLRSFVDISVGMVGIPCGLYIPNNLDAVETLDAFATPVDLTYDYYTTSVWIEWTNVAIHKLKNMGMVINDGELPIIVYLPNNVTDGINGLVTPDIKKNSYIRLDLDYLPNDETKTQDFLLTEPIIHRQYSSSVIQRWKAVPRRTPI